MHYLSVPLTTALYVCTIVFFIVSIFRIENLKWRKPVSNRTQSITIILGRLFCLAIVLFLSFASIDYWEDNYWLITGKYLIAEGYVEELNYKSKD